MSSRWGWLVYSGGGLYPATNYINFFKYIPINDVFVSMQEVALENNSTIEFSHNKRGHTGYNLKPARSILHRKMVSISIVLPREIFSVIVVTSVVIVGFKSAVG